MNTEKKEILLNEKINPQAEQLADLPVAEEQAQLTTGGRTDGTHGTHVAGTIAAIGNNVVG